MKGVLGDGLLRRFIMVELLSLVLLGCIIRLMDLGWLRILTIMIVYARMLILLLLLLGGVLDNVMVSRIVLFYVF